MRLFLILFSVDDPIGKYILDKIVTIAVVFQVFLSFLSFFLTQVGDSRVGNENFGLFAAEKKKTASLLTIAESYQV